MISSRENYHNKGILSINLTPFHIRIQTVIAADISDIAPPYHQNRKPQTTETEFSTLDISYLFAKIY